MAKVPVAETTPVKKLDVESGDGDTTRPGSPVVANGRIEGVQRSLKPRHTQMIAIGGEFRDIFARYCCPAATWALEHAAWEAERESCPSLFAGRRGRDAKVYASK